MLITWCPNKGHWVQSWGGDHNAPHLFWFYVAYSWLAFSFADDLEQTAGDFEVTARRIKKKAWWKNAKVTLIIAVATFALILIIILIVVCEYEQMIINSKSSMMVTLIVALLIKSVFFLCCILVSLKPWENNSSGGESHETESSGQELEPGTWSRKTEWHSSHSVIQYSPVMYIAIHVWCI